MCYIYKKRIIKGVNTDVWITNRVEEMSALYFSYYEWYFMSNGWNSINFDDSSTDQVPFQLIKYNIV